MKNVFNCRKAIKQKNKSRTKFTFLKLQAFYNKVVSLKPGYKLFLHRCRSEIYGLYHFVRLRFKLKLEIWPNSPSVTASTTSKKKKNKSPTKDTTVRSARPMTAAGGVSGNFFVSVQLPALLERALQSREYESDARAPAHYLDYLLALVSRLLCAARIKIAPRK